MDSFHDKNFEGKVALVTGAGKGIGRTVALRLARLGSDVIASDLRFTPYLELGKQDAKFRDSFEELSSLKGNHAKFEGDMSDRKSVGEMFELVSKKYGRLDILVNVAGGAIVEGAIFPHLGIKVEKGQSDPSVFEEELLNSNLDINYKTTVFCSQGAAGLMKKQRSGKIVNIASVSGVMIQDKKFAPYGASKAAVIHYSRYLALELAEYGITVNCILPGPIETERTVDLWKRMGSTEKLLAQIPMHRFGTTDDVANVVQFFASNLSDWVTGQALVLGGGVELSWK
jgi:3-oxoacyl-[acyl-carrier protein] reductase